MRLKMIGCEVFTREIDDVIARSPHSIDSEILEMGLHDLGVEMRPHIQERIDAVDGAGFDAILLGYALCGRGTEGLRAGKTQLVLPRAHDCIGLLMGSRHALSVLFRGPSRRLLSLSRLDRVSEAWPDSCTGFSLQRQQDWGTAQP